jgi:hypothetical protein
MVADPSIPRTIAFETANYLLRTLEPGDAGAGWREWLTNPDAARNLNVRAEPMTEETVRNYIASFDRKRNHLLGIFEKETGRLIGIRAVYIDFKRRDFVMNVLIGESDARHKGARSETRTEIYRFFFEEMDLESCRGTVVEGNADVFRLLKRNGWLFERIEERPAANGGTVRIHHYRLPREVWREKPIG